MEENTTNIHVSKSTYQRSESFVKIATALCAAQGQIKVAPKSSVNPHYNSHYSNLAEVSEACREALVKNGIAVLQPVSTTATSVSVTTLLMHTSGEWISCDITLTPRDMTPQGVGLAITYGRRYGLGTMVGVVSDEDDDGNSGSIAPKKDFPVGRKADAPAPRTAMPKPTDTPMAAPVNGADYANKKEEYKAKAHRIFTDIGVPPGDRVKISKEYLTGFHGGEIPTDPQTNIDAIEKLDKVFMADSQVVREQLQQDPSGFGRSVAKMEAGA